MKLLDLIKKSRSYRRFYQDHTIDYKELELMVEAARLSPSSRNIQPLKYMIVNQIELNNQIFPFLAWAGYLDWDGPVEGERPSAYIIQILDKSITSQYSCDHGITAQSILLQATELGYGGCIIASVKREALGLLLSISNDKYEIINIIALGKPKEEVIIRNLTDNNYKYWRDDNQIHYVPKRRLEDIILKIGEAK